MMRKKTGKPSRASILALAGVVLAVLLFFLPGLFGDRLIGLVSPDFLLRRALPILLGVEMEDQQEAQDDLHGTQEPGQEKILFETVEMEGDVSDKIRFELLGTKSSNIDLSGEAPRVLIYHTHTTEAYTPTAQYQYVVSSEWRTLDEQRNIVAVGEALAQELREKYGIAVIHDTTNHEPPSLGTSYTRSIKTMEKYLEQYPSIDLFIDVHRDALELKEGQKNTDFVTIDGQQVARLMFVVGTGEGKTGAGFSKKPNYKENYALALAVTEQLKNIDSNLTRPIRVKTGRYNQHIPGRALLVEVGHNSNTLEEALNAVPYLAEAIAKTAGKEIAETPVVTQGD